MKIGLENIVKYLKMKRNGPKKRNVNTNVKRTKRNTKRKTKTRIGMVRNIPKRKRTKVTRRKAKRRMTLMLV